VDADVSECSAVGRVSLAVADRAHIRDDGKIVDERAATELTRNQELVHRLAGAGSPKHVRA